MLRPGAVETLVGSGELCSGMLHPDGADVAGAPGHVAFVFGESGLPAYGPVALAPQLQRGSRFDHKFRTLHHLGVEPDDWVSPFHCHGIRHRSVSAFLLASILEIKLLHLQN